MKKVIRLKITQTPIVGKRLSIIFSLLGLTISTFGQNLVSNGDFETTRKANENDWTRPLVPDNWIRTVGSIDFYTALYDTNQTIQSNRPIGMSKWGIIEPYSGNNCVGFMIGYEVISGVLTQPLVKDSLYKLSFYISLNDYIKKGAKYIDIVLTQRSVMPQSMVDYFLDFPIENRIRIKIGRRNSSKKAWVQVLTFYKATGGENFIHFGMNKPKHFMVYADIFKKYWLRGNGYYFMDDVCLKPYIAGHNDSGCEPTYLESKNVETGTDSVIKRKKTIVLEDLFFESGSSSLSSIAKQQLDLVAPILLDYSTDSVFFEISGHTDNTGDEEVNIILSEARALAVSEYLIIQGVPKGKIRVKGYGSLIPILPNTSAYNKRKNRRVEILIYQVLN